MGLFDVGADTGTALVVTDAGEQMGAMAQASERHGHVQGRAAGILAARAIRLDDDVREGFSDGEECRGHRSIIAGFTERSERTGTIGVMTQPPAAPRPPKKRLMNSSLRNIVWALALTMAVVVVVAVGFFGVGSQQDFERTPVPNAQVDVAGSAERAQELVDFPVAVPQPGGDWSARSARFDAGPPARWEVRYSSPAGNLVAIEQGDQLDGVLLSGAVPGAREVGERTVHGVRCTLLEGSGDGEGQRGLACDGGDHGIVVHGQAEDDELEELAAAALESTER